MKRQSKWITLLLIVALCAQVVGALATDSGLEYQEFSFEGGAEMQFAEVTYADTMKANAFVPSGAADEPNAVFEGASVAPGGFVSDCEHDPTDCTYTEETPVYTEETPVYKEEAPVYTEEAPVFTETVHVETVVKTEETVISAPVTEVDVANQAFPTEYQFEGDQPEQAQDEVKQLIEMPTPTLSIMNAPAGLSWTPVTGAARYTIVLTIASLDGRSRTQTIQYSACDGLGTTFAFLPAQLEGTQSITAYLYAEKQADSAHGGWQRMSNNSNTVTYTLTGADAPDDGVDVVIDGTEGTVALAAPVLSFNPDTLTFSWTAVSGADTYQLDIVFLHRDCRPESYPVMNLTGTSYTITDMSLLEGTTGIIANVYAKASDGTYGEPSSEVQHSFDGQRLAAPVLSCEWYMPSFSWTAVDGACSYKLFINYTNTDGTTGSSVVTWQWPDVQLHHKIGFEETRGMTRLTAYVVAVDEDGMLSEASNVVTFSKSEFSDLGIFYEMLPAASLSYNPDTMTFSWTEVEDALTYELTIELEYADGRPRYTWTVTKPSPWLERAYALAERSQQLDGASAVTAYVCAIDRAGNSGRVSNSLRFPIGAEPGTLVAPRIEYDNKSFMLSWIATPGAIAYEVYSTVSYPNKPDAVIRETITPEVSQYGYQAFYFEDVIEQDITRTRQTAYIVAIGADGTRSEPSNTIIYNPSLWENRFLLTFDAATNAISWTHVPNGVRYEIYVSIHYADGTFGSDRGSYTPDVTTHQIDSSLLEGAKEMEYWAAAYHGDENLYPMTAGESERMRHDFTGKTATTEKPATGGGSANQNVNDSDRGYWGIMNGGWNGSANAEKTQNAQPAQAIAAQTSKAGKTARAAQTGRALPQDRVFQPLEPGEYDFATITSNSVNIRATPTTSRSNPLGELQRGEMVALLDTVENAEGTLLEVQTYEGLTGFIPMTYVEMYDGDDAMAQFEAQTMR